jgi:hypothetical protein
LSKCFNLSVQWDLAAVGGSQWLDIIPLETTYKEYLFIHPYPKGFFIIEFDLLEYRDLILYACPWFWGNSGLCMIPWTPCFNPQTIVLSFSLV